MGDIEFDSHGSFNRKADRRWSSTQLEVELHHDFSGDRHDAGATSLGLHVFSHDHLSSAASLNNIASAHRLTAA